MADAERQERQTVIVLGAGASKAEGAPAQAELLSEYFQRLAERRTANHNPRLQHEITSYFCLLWGIEPDPTTGSFAGAKFPTFEEALGLLEIAHARGEFFKGFSGGSQYATRAQEMRVHLVSLIALVLKNQLRRPRGHHGRLITALRERGDLASTTFLNLNYDLLLDNALQAKLGRPPDYGIEFCNQPRPCRRGEPRAQLLKLHGSLNWLLCPTCNGISLYPGEKVVADFAELPLAELSPHATCPRCEEPRVPVIIPPTFFKVMSNFYLQQIWRLAEERLMAARTIIFCGYSFPDADLHVKYLLKRAEVNRGADDDPPFVFVVNHYPRKRAAEIKAERERYTRFFRRKDHIRWTNLSFEEFASNPRCIRDPSRWVK